MIVNNADQALQVRLMLPCSHGYDGVPLRDALGAAPDTKVPATEPHTHYTYFKPRNRG